MAVTFGDPRALWLLLAVPLVWGALRYSRTNFNGRQRRLQAGVRSLVLALLALAMAQPVASTRSAGASIVYLVDVSHSVASRGITDAATEIDRLTAAIRPVHTRIVAFAGTTAPLPDTAALRALAAPEADATERSRDLRRDESDLERALDDARAELQSGRSPRIVVFSDGRETSGDARTAARRLGASGIPVFTVPIEVRNLGDAWVDAVSVPPRVVAGAAVPVVVQVTTQKPASGQLELRDGSKSLGTQSVTLTVGTTAVNMLATFESPGTRLLVAALDVAGDPLAENNTLGRDVVVERRSRVLYVESQGTSAKYLRGALEHAGFDVDVRDPKGLPTGVPQLDPWDVVVLSDVARADISNAAMSALSTWVEHQGGGLLIAGGANVFGVGAKPNVPGYRNSELERLMPVTFERNDDPAVALVIILDKSWSMAGQVIALCKAAAQAAVDVLGDDHLAGVITFNDSFKWDVTLRPVGPNRSLIKAAIGDIEASGYTVIYPAIEQAFDALKNSRARAKHVVLLSDGKSSPADYEGLVKKMVASKITVSTLAVGAGADADLLTDIATWGNGRSYVVMDPRQVTQIFVTEAKGAATPALEEGKPIAPKVLAPTFFRGVDLTQMPALHGRTATVLKDHALEVLSTDTKDPLLAFWPIGLGRTAVFASDVKDRWGTDWIRWRGYGPFFGTLVHALERPRVPALDVTASVVRGGLRTLSVAVEARDAQGAYRNLLKPMLRITTDDGASATATARQVSPGRYEATLVADARRPLTVTLVEGEGLPATSRLLVNDPASEYRFRSPDEDLLQAVAAVTGGQLRPEATTIARASGAEASSRRALWPMLVLAALAFWLVDILVRRVRLFEATA